MKLFFYSSMAYLAGCLHPAYAQIIKEPAVDIPIKVHVLYKSESFNITDDEIIAEIGFLTRDFKGINADTTDIPDDFKYFFAKPKINFYLATDPTTGKPAIYRYSRAGNHFSLRRRNVFKKQRPVEPEKFLNIYIASIRKGKTLGYVNSEPWNDPGQDGVVLHTGAVKEHIRVITHEVGHWLGLYHIFSQDEVEDTPTQNRTKGCPHHPKNDFGHPVMFCNFMDYSDCRVMFTKGQVAKMLGVIQNFRSEFITQPQ